MTITREQNQRASVSLKSVATVSYSSTPHGASLLIAVVSTYADVTVTGMTQTGVTWDLIESASSAGSGASSTRCTVLVAVPNNVLPTSAQVDFTFSGVTDAGIIIIEYSGVSGDTKVIQDWSGDDGTRTPFELDLDMGSQSDRQLYFAAGSKGSSNGSLFEVDSGTDPDYTSIDQVSGNSQFIAAFEKIVSVPESQYLLAEYTGHAVWAGVSVIIKEFPGDWALADQIYSYQLTDSAQTEMFPIVESDTVVASGQVDVLSVGGGADHPVGDPIRIGIESEVTPVTKSSITIEVKYGAGSYQSVYENEVFVVPSSEVDSVITELENGWAFLIAPLGFWPGNTLIGVKITADSLTTPFEYSFTTADEGPLVRGVTFVQAAIGRTP